MEVHGKGDSTFGEDCCFFGVNPCECLGLVLFDDSVEDLDDRSNGFVNAMFVLVSNGENDASKSDAAELSGFVEFHFREEVGDRSSERVVRVDVCDEGF